MFAKFLKDESGATAIEYGILAALMAVMLVTAVPILGGKIVTLFKGIETDLSTKTPDTTS